MPGLFCLYKGTGLWENAVVLYFRCIMQLKHESYVIFTLFFTVFILRSQLKGFFNHRDGVLAFIRSFFFFLRLLPSLHVSFSEAFASLRAGLRTLIKGTTVEHNHTSRCTKGRPFFINGNRLLMSLAAALARNEVLIKGAISCFGKTEEETRGWRHI